MKKHQLQILGHRGFSASYAENSLESFRAAIEAGADGIELDIQKDADNRFRVIHDETPARTCTGLTPQLAELSIRKLSSHDLENADCGDGNPPPFLEDVIRLVLDLAEEKNSALIINIELKHETLTVEDTANLVDILAGYTHPISFIISSFHHNLLFPAARAGYKTGMLIGDNHRRDGFAGLRNTALKLSPFSVHFPVQIFITVSPFLRWLMLYWFRSKGIKLIFWTVNEHRVFLRLPKTTHAIITDDPLRVRAWVS